MNTDLSKTFPTFNEAKSYACELTQNEHVIASRCWHDRFKRYRPRTVEGKLLGWSKKAVKDCERMAPGGNWQVGVEFHSQQPKILQLSVGYSRYLPYAWAMANAENGYKAFGLDFDCVNSFFNTCMGYYYLGMGHFSNLETADSYLYDRLYTECSKVWSPSLLSLPFDEVYGPALCFLAVQAPKLFARCVDGPTDWRALKIAEVLGNLDLPYQQPRHRKLKETSPV